MSDDAEGVREVLRQQTLEFMALEERCSRLTAEVRRLRDALNFYADEASWSTFTGMQPALLDRGRRARSVIRATDEEFDMDGRC